MIEIAEEFIEAMSGWQHIITITKMVLAKLARHIALLF